MEISILNGSLSSMWPASFASLSFVQLASLGSFACLDSGPGTLFLFLSLSWVLSFYKVRQGFIIIMVLCHVVHVKNWGKKKKRGIRP
jgi:hypothetical protein